MNFRTKEEFDEWFSKGDPWAYHSSYVKDRFKSSWKFVSTYCHSNFKGTIIDLGAYRGEFTEIVAQHCPNARILAVDISTVATEQAKKRLAVYSNVQCICCDMLNFDFTVYADGENGCVILMMESLYYMARDEQGQLIGQLRSNLPEATLIVSAPMIGEGYYFERELLRLFGRLDYLCQSAAVLNLKYMLKPMRLFIWLANRWGIIRRLMGYQVIYCFVPAKMTNK